ncbi:16360_t:CDS:1, partial [Funneliformis geosporum]
VVGFDNVMKVNILAEKMVRRFTSPNPFNNTAENTDNTLQYL